MNIISLLLTIFVLLLILVFVLIDILAPKKHLALSYKYRLRRFLNWFSLGLGYSAIYIGRYNFSLLSIVKLSNDRNIVSTSEFGWIMSIGYWTYAFTSPFTGSIGDFIGPKPCVVIGVIGSGLINIILGLSLFGNDSPIIKTIPPTLLFGFFNGLNFLFQSLATGSVNKINTGWYNRSELGVFGGIFSAVLATAYFFTLNVGEGILNSPLSWNFLFIAPGGLLLVAGIFCLFIVYEKPHQCGWDVDLTDTKLLEQHHDHPDDVVIDSHSDEQHHDTNFGNIKMSKIRVQVEHHSDIESEDDKESRHPESFISDDSNGGGAILSTFNINTNAEDYIDSYEISNKLVLENSNNIDKSQLQQLQQQEPLQEKKSISIVLKQMVKEVLKKENIQPLLSKENILNGFSLFCIGWIKEGFIAWYTPFLKDKFGPNPSESLLSVCTAGVSIGAMTGGFLCGLLSDFAFNSKRAPSLFIFFFLLNILIGALYLVSNSAVATMILVILMIIMFGTNNVLAVTALLDLGTVRNAALMAGLLTMFQYVASGFSGFFLGYIVEKFGYGYWILSMIPFSLVAMVLQLANGIQELLFWKRWIKLGKSNPISSLHSDTQIEFN